MWVLTPHILKWHVSNKLSLRIYTLFCSKNSFCHSQLDSCYFSYFGDTITKLKLCILIKSTQWSWSQVQISTALKHICCILFLSTVFSSEAKNVWNLRRASTTHVSIQRILELFRINQYLCKNLIVFRINQYLCKNWIVFWINHCLCKHWIVFRMNQ